MTNAKNIKFAAAPLVDLTNCDREPIHIPGRIQSHGFLIAVNKKTGIVNYVSDNIDQFTGVKSEAIINKDYENFLKKTNPKSLFVDLNKLVHNVKSVNCDEINPVNVQFQKAKFNLIVHFSGEYVLMEFEPADLSTELEIQRLMGISLSKILEAHSIDKTLHFAAHQVKEIIGYDRVMIYKFWEDGHGEVVAEEKNEDLESFFGLHYPASDIPKQARQLYKINLVRIIADVSSTPAALVVGDETYESKPLDLTHSTLRAVSPIHIQYLQNMGVKASFSISIMLDDELWGLIACHNYSPKFIDYRARNSAKLIGRILSSSLDYRQKEEKKRLSHEYQEVLQTILNRASKDWNIESSLVKNEDANILKLTNASGAALLYENNIYTLGQTPPKSFIADLVNWLKNINDSIFHTNSLSKLYSAAENHKLEASGLLSCTLSREMNEYILWFKPELKQQVKWAGNPEKPVEIDSDGNMKLSPRRSFEVWSQEVAGHSAPWDVSEISSVMKLQEEITRLINQKASQIRQLNEELKKAYNELDTFSFTISHDLKTPLTSIKNFTEILLEDYEELPQEVIVILKKIVKSADRMNMLIREVLSYSRIGRQKLDKRSINMKQMIENIVSESINAYGEKTKFTLSELPPIMGDEVMIYQVFSNIISNAVKYSAKSDAPEVTITGEETENEIIYSIKDNGIGIDMRNANQVFDLFKRMENAQKYDGSGVGLAIVKRIMDKHNGHISYESELLNGTIFYLSFKKS